MTGTTRRGFLVGCSAAFAGLTGARFTGLAFADPARQTNDEILVVLFARGGMDGLNLVLPIAGPDRDHYETARSELQVPITGEDAALPLDAQFGLHPSAAPLLPLWQAGKLSMVHASGLDVANRSHFDAQAYMELGTPGLKTTSTGWLTRHLQSTGNLPPEMIMPSLAVGSTQQISLLGDTDTVNMEDPDYFNINTGPWAWRDAQRLTLRQLVEGDDTWLHASSLQAMDAMDVVELAASGDYQPANGAVYPDGSLGEHLQLVAQMIKSDLGLRVATLDTGGWDTHNGQGAGAGGFFSTLVEDLAAGMAAFYQDLDGAGDQNYSQRMTCVVMSEFGRRFRENADVGTDHGHGNLMMVMGGNATGGFHGQWPGLDYPQLFEGVDLDVTTDFRRVLSEILIRRLGNNMLGHVFPGYTGYSPLGVVQGVDLPPNYGAQIFSDGFESGDLAAWGG